jgi:hypothetical protein
MDGDLAGQVRVDVAILDASAKAAKPACHHAVSRTTRMAFTSSSNSARSAARCFRPALVIV